MADYFAKELNDDRIDRAPKHGAKDIGDIINVRTRDGRKLCIEAKDWGGQIKAAEAMTETEVETENYGALAGVAVIKRKGVADPAKQWVLTTAENLVWLIRGER